MIRKIEIFIKVLLGKYSFYKLKFKDASFFRRLYHSYI